MFLAALRYWGGYWGGALDFALHPAPSIGRPPELSPSQSGYYLLVVYLRVGAARPGTVPSVPLACGDRSATPQLVAKLSLGSLRSRPLVDTPVGANREELHCRLHTAADEADPDRRIRLHLEQILGHGVSGDSGSAPPS